MILLDKIQHVDLAVTAFALTRVIEVVARTSACVIVSALSTLTARRHWAGPRRPRSRSSVDSPPPRPPRSTRRSCSRRFAVTCEHCTPGISAGQHCDNGSHAGPDHERRAQRPGGGQSSPDTSYAELCDWRSIFGALSVHIARQCRDPDLEHLHRRDRRPSHRERRHGDCLFGHTVRSGHTCHAGT
jgi:hypothetical protein